MDSIKAEFNAKIKHISEEKKGNNILYSKAKYDEIIQKLKEQSNNAEKNKDYYITKKFQLITFGNVEQLTLKPVGFITMIAIFMLTN